MIKQIAVESGGMVHKEYFVLVTELGTLRFSMNTYLKIMDDLNITDSLDPVIKGRFISLFN